MDLNNKHKKTLTSIFATPIRSNILWTDVERLFVALGGSMTQGNGSRVRVKLNGVRSVFHEPHPGKETDKGALVRVRIFLETAGIVPEEDD
jgi:HicA toxin of bacterial toxin-antitoxin,